MSGLFGGDSPSAPQAPPAPTANDAEVAGQASADALRRRRGMAASILAGSSTGTNTPTTQAKTLLGG